MDETYADGIDLFVSQFALYVVPRPEKAVEELFGSFFGLVQNSPAIELVSSKCDILDTILSTKQ